MEPRYALAGGARRADAANPTPLCQEAAALAPPEPLSDVVDVPESLLDGEDPASLAGEVVEGEEPLEDPEVSFGRERLSVL